MASCPAMGVLQGMEPGVKTEWSVLPGMYAYSGLGQEVPAELPAWWACVLGYAGAGAMARVIGAVAVRRRRVTSQAGPASL